MNRWVRVLSALLITVVLSFGLMGEVGAAPTDAAPLKALIVNGQNNHGWKTSSPILKQILEQTELFKVDVATSPPKGSGGMESFKPSFAAHDVLVLDYNGESWPEQTKTAFVEYVKSGGGVVVYHAADNSFPEWKEFNEIIGLGGWRGRDEKSGPYIRWRDGKVVRDTTPGRGGDHGPRHAFQVVNRNREHPITKGLPQKWMHAEDELYAKLRGPARNLTVLATAYSDPQKRGTGEHEPILFTINYGRGRVFHTVLGHVGGGSTSLPAMECAGFIVTFQRGAEWAATGKVTQEVPEGFPTATEARTWKGYKPSRPLDQLLALIATYEYGQSREPLTELTDLVRDSDDSPQQRKQIERRLVKLLRSDATPAGKQFICGQLSIIATADAVPTLAAMLTQKAISLIEPSDMARYALERIPGPAADKALRDALDKTTGKVRIGIINSLGERGDKEAVAKLKGLLSDDNREIVRAAISALGKIGGVEAAEALRAAKPTARGQLYFTWADAYLKCADKLLAEGSRRPAIRIYRRMYHPREPALVRVAALRGIITARPDRSGRLASKILKGSDQVMQAAVIGLLREIPGTEIIRAMSAELPNLSTAGQVQLLSALADRGDRSALPAVLEATERSEPDIRIAAFEAVGALGDASTVDLLARAAATAGGAEQEAARQSLYRLRGQEADRMILSSIPNAEAKVKVELIRSIGERNIETGVGTLLKTAQAPQVEVRVESLKVLKVIAGQEHLPALVKLLTDARSEAERTEAVKTIAAVARKIPASQNRAEAVMHVLPSIKDVAVRCSLLSVLGKIGDDRAIGVLRKALNDGDADVRAAAIRSLSDWPTAEPMADLLQVARRAQDQRHRVLAMRGYVRMIALDSNRSADETVGIYKEVMDLTSNADVKTKVLSELANIKTPAALEMAARYLSDEALQQEAEAAVVKIADGTRGSHPQKTKEVLQRLIQISKNDSLLKQAQRMIEKMEQFESFLTTWEVAGPYTKGNYGPSELFDIIFEPEKPDAASVKWRLMPASTEKDKPWLLELDKAIGGTDRVAYLRTNVWSPKQQRARLELGSNDGIKVWLNGRVIHANNVLRAINRKEDIVEVTLRKSWNSLMMKITQNGGTWSACASLRAPDGGKLEGMKVRAENQ